MDNQLYAQVQLLAATVEALEEQVTNGWKESAKLVLADLERQGAAIERHEQRFVSLQENLTTRLGQIHLEVTESRSEMRGRLNLTDQKIKAACRKIGKSEACLEHTEQLSALNERVEQHNHQQRERFKVIRDLWSEIGKLRKHDAELGKAISAVDKSGGVAHAEWRTVLWVVGASVGTSGVFWATVKLAGKLF